jgi:hypothetical protein
VGPRARAHDEGSHEGPYAQSATVVALAALVVAMSGSAVAAGLITSG